jgi:hypothetical protein
MASAWRGRDLLAGLVSVTMTCLGYLVFVERVGGVAARKLRSVNTDARPAPANQALRDQPVI